MSPESPSQVANARSLPLWTALHWGVAMVAGDLLINLYHRPPGLESFGYALLPALTLGGVATLVFLAAVMILTLAGLGTEMRSPGGLTGLAVVAGAMLMGFQWAEASPYVYSRLLGYFLFGSLACAAAGHAILRMAAGARDTRRTLTVCITVLAWVSTALHLAAWLLLAAVESRWGYDTSRRVEQSLNLFGGVTLALGCSVFAVWAGSVMEAWRWNKQPVRWLLVPAPYAVLTLALFRWRAACGTHPAFPSQAATLIPMLPLVLVISVIAAFALPLRTSIRIAFASAFMFLIIGAGWTYGPAALDRTGLHAWRADPAAVRRIIFVTSDALRSDVLEPYGGTDIATPNLNAFAADSVVFDEAISAASWTLPAFAGMFTGLNPGVFDEIGVHWRMSDSTWSLPERLGAKGYFTGAIGMNPLLRPRHGLDQGFQTYDFFPRDARPRTLGARCMAAVLPDLFRTDRTSGELKDLAVDWIDRNQRRDFFLWLHFWDPHTPLGPPPEFRPDGEAPPWVKEPWERSMEIKNGEYLPPESEKVWLRRLYLGEVRYVDAMFGELVRHLKESGLYEDSLIIFSSDHGEEFWDHDGFGHGQSLFHELIHVPLMVKLPGRGRSGRIAGPVSTVSLTPTLLDFAAVGYDPGEFSVPSLAPLLGGVDGEWVASPIYSETAPEAFARHRWGVRYGEFQYMQGPRGEAQEELYDLEADPDENHDVAGERPEAAAEGRRNLQDYGRQNELLRHRHEIEDAEQLELAPEDLDHLRKLGYI